MSGDLGNVFLLRDGKHFALESEVAKRLKDLILEYEGRISLVSAIGILEVVKIELHQGNE